MPDFTRRKYQELLEKLSAQDYQFQTFAEFLNKAATRSIILRHDVDLLPGHSLAFARMEATLGLRGSYYFRALPCSWDEKVIREIASLGHEIGYHYEDLSLEKGDRLRAMDSFRRNLAVLRELVPVETICMHGSPRSPHDSRELWKEFNYRELDLIGEPYFDIDFSNMLYLTDTGRRWDGHRVSVRDKVDPAVYRSIEAKGYRLHTTDDIIAAFGAGVLADRIMITLHPQRWHSRPLPWLKELVFQNLKNVAKRRLLALGR